VFLGVTHAPLPRELDPKFFETYMRAHSVRNNNQRLHGDQTKDEDNTRIVTVDHEYCLRLLTFLFGLWNTLPDTVVTALSDTSFKRRLCHVDIRKYTVIF